MNDFKLGTCTVPDGVSGNWEISTFEVTEADARMNNMRAMFSRNAVMMISSGTYRRLTCKGRGVIMSNTPMEIRTNRDAYNRATGRVLINGLGMGMLLEAILSKPDVTYVRVIEIEQDVINLTAPHFADDPRVEIIHADAMTYKPAKGEKFDYAWHDIWDDICADNLTDMAKLSRRYNKRVCTQQDHWARAEIRANMRR